ncbi:hypothetical protein LMG33818_002623 [Halomonadaceae bacterium LMG 33818]|uniref:phage virion morphogenesis protein n=1 Tax=Cernens ardua TaxID=3402176 RepID=UPI003EDBD6F0
MSNELVLENWTAPLIARLSPSSRRALTRKIAIEVRREQRDRIKTQHAPDGTSYTPRAGAQKRGDIKRRAMFSKIRTARFMKTTTSPNRATIGYTGRNARIATVHQKGLMDYVSKKSQVKIRYPSRPLLGVSRKTRTIVEKAVIDHLNL